VLSHAAVGGRLPSGIPARTLRIEYPGAISSVICRGSQKQAFLHASPAPGLYQQSVTVTLTAADNLDPSPKIFYTTDGTDPRTGGLLYSGPLSLTNDTPLQFAAVDRRSNGEAAVHSTNYTVNHAPVPAAPAIRVRPGKTATSLISPNNTDQADTVFTYAVTAPPVHGTATVSAAGLVTFTADKKYTGSDSIIIGVQDPRGGAATVTIPVTVSK
jgi:hypothetical protein